jgi:hypothetical protein
VVAAMAAQADVCTKAHDCPIEAPAWMGLPQPHDIIEIELEGSVLHRNLNAGARSDRYIRPGMLRPPVSAPSFASLAA